MILTDAGPLIALIDQGEADHEACVACLAQLTPPMITSWPAFTEAHYLLGEAAGWRGQAALWRFVSDGHLEIRELDPALFPRLEALLAKYQELPMDLADATLVCLAEELKLDSIFTLDHRDFRIYRLHGRGTFKIWPQL